MNTQPPDDPRTMTWVDKANHYWRIERLAGRWQLSRYSPASETWQRIGSFRPVTRDPGRLREE